MDKEYRYFDKIDIDYIKLKNGDCNNLEEYNRIDCAKNDKYKDCDLDYIDKASVTYKGIYDTIYHRITRDIEFYDNLIWHKFFNEEYNGVKGVRTADEICRFYKELIDLLEKDDIDKYVDFTDYVQRLEYEGRLSIDKYDSNQSTNPANISNNVERNRNDDKFNYKLMHDLLYSYIPNGTEEIYRSVIEKHVLPLKAQTLRMKDDKKSDIVRFADCFKISIREINMIFDIKVKANDRPKNNVNNFYRLLRQINPDFTAK